MKINVPIRLLLPFDLIKCKRVVVLYTPSKRKTHDYVFCSISPPALFLSFFETEVINLITHIINLTLKDTQRAKIGQLGILYIMT